MILGSGVDIMEVKRIKSSIDNWGDRFLKKIFTDKEIKYSKGKRFSCQHFAARFAGKEAVVKAFGNNEGKSIRWKDVEISNDKYGKPYAELFGQYKKFKLKKKINKIIVSLSHTREYAVATAILTGKDKKQGFNG